MAMGFRHRNDAARTYVVVGDGELQEGEIWEGAMCAAHYKLHNLCAIVDYNKLQSDNSNENIIGLEPLRAKWEAFNWKVLEVDGHNPQQINQAFISAEASCDAPTVVIAHTVKGKGVSFMEGVPAWHGSVKLRTTELELALHDLGVPEKYIPAYIDGSIWRLKS
jgi:transketolase